MTGRDFNANGDCYSFPLAFPKGRGHRSSASVDRRAGPTIEDIEDSLDSPYGALRIHMAPSTGYYVYLGMDSVSVAMRPVSKI